MRKTYLSATVLIFLSVATICANSISLTAGHCKEPSGSKKKVIRKIFFVPQTGQIGCSYFATSFGERGKISFFSIEDGREINSMLLGPGETGDLIASSHDGNVVGVASFVWGKPSSTGVQNVGIGCYSLAENKWLWRANWPDWEETGKDSISDTIFSQDDKQIIAAGKRSVLVYDASSGKVLKKWREPFKDYPLLRFSFTEVAFASDARSLVIWQEYQASHLKDFIFGFLVNRKVTVWDIEQYKLAARWRRPKELYWGGTLPDEVIFGSPDGYVRAWSISEQKMLRKWRAYWGKEGSERDAYASHLMALTTSQDGRYLATKGYRVGKQGEQGSWEYVIKIWNLETGRFIREFTDIRSGVFGEYPMVFSPDNRYFAFDQNGKLCLCDTETWKEKWCVPNADGDKS